MNPVDIAEPLRSRWSPSSFDPTHELTTAELSRLLEAAQWAPSGGNRQPWRFFVAPRGSAVHDVLVPHLSRGNSGWVPRASAVLIATALLADEGEEPGDPTFPAYGVGLAAGQVVLQARAMGLHAHQFAGFDHDAVAAALEVPAHAKVLTGIAVGRRGAPDGMSERDAERDHRERRRLPLAEIAFGARWGEPFPGLQASGPTVAEVAEAAEDPGGA
ncbi:nitroreductase family protein [Nocardioides caeni]|uniref:Nitroreductase n=1 Tax=Nocardioides caeni TaxID=574700 RepID=A0A4S8N3E1_9ACTN|nr:nitroreductase family protein [Nocardioides caeni]THV10498.1 nitroreductase [Nocardioides caeni]